MVNVSDGNSEDSDLAIHNCTEFDCYATVKEATGPTEWQSSSDRFPIFSDIAIMLVHFGLIHGSFDFLSWILHIFLEIIGFILELRMLGWQIWRWVWLKMKPMYGFRVH